MFPSARLARTCLLLASLVPSAATQETLAPDAVLLRQPDISQDEVVFRYGDDLWLVDKRGGVARRVTSGGGRELSPKFAPDGKRIAFVGAYEGGSDLYTLELAGGVPVRHTFHPQRESLCDWTPAGNELIYFSSEASFSRRAPKLFRIAVPLGSPRALPVPYGTFGAIDGTETWLAYTPSTREGRTWKRYQGGMAQDVWLVNLKTGESRRVTDHPGTDRHPMWHGRKLYFLSDRGPNARLNLYVHDPKSGETTRLTDYRQEDIRWPSMGPDDIVFEAGGRLIRYEFATGERIPIEVRIPGARPELLERAVDVRPNVVAAQPGPKGVRAVVEARGELFSVPKEKGVTRNLTRTDGVAERDPAWSPDGRWIAYLSDRSGNYELTLRDARGEAFEGADENGERRLSSLGAGWKSDLVWSPDSERIAFGTNDGALHVLEVATGEQRVVVTSPDGSAPRVRFSPDGRWLTFAMSAARDRLSTIRLFDLTTDTMHEVTSGMYLDTEPVFDRGGGWLYYRSLREFEPTYEDFGTTWIYADASTLVAVPLRADVENPFALVDPHEEPDDDETAPAAEDPAETAESAGDGAAFTIVLEGFEARAHRLPVPAGRLSDLEAGRAGELLYLRGPRSGADGEPALVRFVPGEDDEEEVLADVVAFRPCSAGALAFVETEEGSYGFVPVEPDATLDELDLTGLVMRIRPRTEWRQLLDDVHRIFRDFFYDEGMHGVNWDAVHGRFVGLLPYATSRADVHDFIGDMLAELNVGHAYNRPPTGGLGERVPPSQPAGLLGCDWELERGAWRIAHILCSEAPYELEARSPLAAPGVDVAAGDWLLEVNGVFVDGSRDVHAALLGTVGRPTELTVNVTPLIDGNERRVVVVPLEDDDELRYRDWVSANRRFVDGASEGRIGYVHVPDTGIHGQNELFRQFQGERGHAALIVDERWNGGGQIPLRFIELLDRPVSNFWALRHGEDLTWPPVGHHGPKAMLINGWSGSGGDLFPYYFRQHGLGPLIGRRTWGGLVGISGNPSLIDGSTPTVPRFAFYETDGTWGIEGYGVEPDIEVLDDPAEMQGGRDPQLVAAIEQLLLALEGLPETGPVRPRGPDRSGAGVAPADR